MFSFELAGHGKEAYPNNRSDREGRRKAKEIQP
jgi:hypothetical protein